MLDGNLFPVLSRTHDLHFDVASYGITYQEFSFLYVARTNQIGLMAFVKAYDLLNWISTGTACIFLSATIAAMTGKYSHSFGQNFYQLLQLSSCY